MRGLASAAAAAAAVAAAFVLSSSAARAAAFAPPSSSSSTSSTLPRCRPCRRRTSPLPGRRGPSRPSPFASATTDDDDGDEESGTTTTKTTMGEPGTAELDVPWSELGFEFRPTRSHLRMVYRDGEWGEMEMVEEPYMKLHIGATALHYGQSCFEGLKAFAHEDGTVHIFRPDENAKRMRASCERTMMPPVPPSLFVSACMRAVRENISYVPPYGSGGALYLRPLLFGSGPRIGLQPSDEYTFLVMVIPVGDYYRGGLSSPVDALIIEDFDRAAPRGVGNVKVAGNYAADLLPNMLGKRRGFPIGLYLDAATHTLVEEFSTSNFVRIDNSKKKYVTPRSPSVLPSITNKSLMTIARDEGFDVEERDVPVEEMRRFDEVMAVGTAVVVTPVGSATRLGGGGGDGGGNGGGEDGDGEDGDGDEAAPTAVYRFGREGEVGETTRRLYDRVRAIQLGDEEDAYGWNFRVE